ncbi:MAG TPA: hypothetical protein VMS21_04005 [Methylomirabilota bacterium]|nr:hypothetical protein [Methylomirabilota bacterium]
MNLNRLQNKLIASARANPPGDRVPYAFEKRVMARLTGIQPLDQWTLWSQALWRAAVPCLLLCVALAVWSLTTSFGIETDLASAFEQSVFAPLETVQLAEGW